MRGESLAQHKNSGYLSAFGAYNFRLYFIGQLISTSGTWMQRVAQSWLVYSLTQSEGWLGFVAGVSGISMLLVAPMAGVWVDRFPRRLLLFAAQAVEMVLAFLLAYLTFTSIVRVEHIVVLSFCLGLTTAVGDPARRALLNDLVKKSDMASGISLSATMINMAAVIGPTLAGVALLRWGTAVCFFVNGLSYLAVLASLLFIQIVDDEETAVSPSTPLLQQIQEGIRYLKQKPAITVKLLTATINGAFGIGMIYVLLPAYASKNLHQPETGLVALSAAIGFGSIIAGLGNVWLGRRWGQQRLATFCLLLLPFGSILLAQINQLQLAVFLAATLGFGYTIFFVTTNILVQLEVDDAYRGRVLSLWSMGRFGINPIAAIVIGGLAQILGISALLWLCGVLTFVLCGWILFSLTQAERR